MKKVIKLFLFAILIFCCIGCSTKIFYQKFDKLIITIVDEEVQHKAGDTLNLNAKIFNNSDEDFLIYSSFPTFTLHAITDFAGDDIHFVSIADSNITIKPKSDIILPIRFQSVINTVINNDLQLKLIYRISETIENKIIQFNFASKNKVTLKK